MSMEDALTKIRPHANSALAHQKTPATLLQALESTIQDKTSPTAYFAALLTTLDATLQKEDIALGDGDMLPAELYLIALVIPFVSHPVIRANLSTVLGLTAPLFPVLQSHAPPLRSQLSIYSSLLAALDRSQLEVQGVRQSFASILQLCLDPRPKVRKRAADVVKDTLATPPTPMIRHPYAERVAEWIKNCLVEVNSGLLPAKSSAKSPESPTSETAIHILAFLRPVLLNLPPTSLPAITNLLLTLPRLGNPYLSQSAYSILSDLFSAPLEDEGSTITPSIPAVLSAVLASPPSKADATLPPAWLRVLGSAMLAYSAVDSDACAGDLPKVWKTVWAFLESTHAATRNAAAESLGLLAQCFPPALVSAAIEEAKSKKAEPKTALGVIIAQVTKSLDALAFARSMPELLAVISSLLTHLRYAPDPTKRLSTEAAETLLLPLVHRIGDLRTQKGFEYKEAADACLAVAMRTLGPEIILSVLPLNLEPTDRQAGNEPRAYLLPLLAQPHPSPLGHFVAYFVPLSERMFTHQQAAETANRASEAKVWSVLVAQIWAGLAGYCHSPPDLTTALGPGFAVLLSQLLYTQPELRPAVLRALKVLVESSKNPELTSPLSSKEAEANVAFLRTQAESWLAVLFNVFGSVGRDGRGMVGDVISAWASVAGEEEITKAQHKVIGLFQTNLAKAASGPPSHHGASEEGSVTAMTQDILILLLPYLSSADATALFEMCLAADILGSRDNGVQKRGYKILAKLVESGKFAVNPEEVLGKLDELSGGLSSAAKKDRFALLALLIPMLPSGAMHVIPSLIPEAVLGTKEPSEKARSAAFDLIVSMGRKMAEGGIVKRGMIDGMDEESEEAPGEAVASVEEYMTMVAGGLAGATPHMISATITAISRLVFEFKDTISSDMQSEIFTTHLVFLTSANREIVKSTLGYIKLAIHTLAPYILRPHLKQLVPALLRWSHDHKNHFKAKVRHIFERMLRRFGWNEVYQCAGEEEAAKVLVNIKKRKERAKRKKNAREEGDEDEAPPAKPAAGEAFEDVLYGSESELDSDDGGPSASAPAPKRKVVDHGARLRVDDDEPMDLLSGAASRITNAKSDRRRKPGQDAARFKTDEETGKMVIDSGDESDIEASAKRAATDVAGTAYKESMTSVDGFTRGPNGRVKFNKDTKKRRRENDEAEEDVEMADGETGKSKKNKRKSEVKFGQEFKAKKAGGDIKKGGVDPYAYMSLSQAAKRGGKGGQPKAGIAGKR